MSPNTSPLGEQTFLSADVARLSGVSLRQLQWWDERKVVSPAKDGHRRIYVPEQVLEILTMAALRRKGLSLQKMRRILRLLRRELEQQGSRLWSAKSEVYLVTDGRSIFIDDQPKRLLSRVAEELEPMYVVCLSEQMKRVLSEKPSRGKKTVQLRLF